MYKMDSHIHSEYSPDSKAKLEDIFKVAKSRDLDIIAISDHNTVEGSKEARKLTKNDDLLVIPSIEISSLEGHILGFGCEEYIERDCRLLRIFRSVCLQQSLQKDQWFFPQQIEKKIILCCYFSYISAKTVNF